MYRKNFQYFFIFFSIFFSQKLDNHWIVQDFLIGGSRRSHMACNHWAMWPGGSNSKKIENQLLTLAARGQQPSQNLPLDLLGGPFAQFNSNAGAALNLIQIGP
ncbi:unnamed protein product [Prunus armeniaca]